VPSFLFVAGFLIFIVLGQLLVNKPAVDVRGAESLVAYARNPFVIVSFSSAVVAAIWRVKARQHNRLNFAYPFMSLSFVMVGLLSVLIFGEEFRSQKWIGLSIVFVGRYVGSR